MYDAKGAQSQAVSLKFEDKGNKTVLTLSADSNWLSASERAFPIVVDPDIILDENVWNTYIQRDTDGKSNNTNFSTDPTLQVGYDAFYSNGTLAYDSTYRALLNFEVKNKVKFPSGSNILSAKVSLYKNGYVDNRELVPELYKAGASWDVNTVTWSNQPGVSTEIGLPKSISDNWYTYDVTGVVQEWLTSSTPEYGFYVKDNETTVGRSLFNSSRMGFNGPQLEVEWVADYYAGYKADIPTVMLSRQTLSVPVALSNGGTMTWPTAGTNPVKLSYHWEDMNGTPVGDGLETPLPYDVPSGEAVQVNAQIQAPATPGKYKLRMDLNHMEPRLRWSIGLQPTERDGALGPLPDKGLIYLTRVMFNTA